MTTDRLDAALLARDETLYHCANGYLGVRACLEEGAPDGAVSIRGTYINGFFDDTDIKYGELFSGFPTVGQRMINVMDAQSMVLYVNGQKLDMFSGGVNSFLRELDMQNGVSVRSFRWNCLGGEFDITITRTAHFCDKRLFTIEYRVTPLDRASELKFESSIDGGIKNYADPNDPRIAAESAKTLRLQSSDIIGDTMLMTCCAPRSKLQVSCAVRHVLSLPARSVYSRSDETLSALISVNAEAGQSISVVKYCAYSDSRRDGSTEGAALESLECACALPLGTLYDRQRDYLDAFWRDARVTITGDKKAQLNMDFCLYGLLESTGTDGISGVCAKGLSGEGYEGHYFWDMDTFIYPFWLYSGRKEAKKLLDYRFSLLDAARANARALGHEKGALYPWRTIAGSECSSYFPSGSAQYHINGDIAFAFSQYYAVTGDIPYMAEKGAQVLVETARFWLDVGHYNGERFCIDCVTGPDEYTCLVNNNFYTNVCAKHNLQSAADICRKLEKHGMLDKTLEAVGICADELEAFEHAANAMYLPYDKTLGINPQDDSFLSKARWELSDIPKAKMPLLLHYHPLYIYRRQVCKQADTVLAYYLFEGCADADTMRRSYDYYEKLTTHDSSLSKCVFSIMAARLGDADKAYSYFCDSCSMDIDDAHGNTRDGVHTANMGGAYLAVLAGFAGLRLYSDRIALMPMLPPNWNGIGFSLGWRGRRLRVDITANECIVSLQSGEPFTAEICGRNYTVSGITTISITEDGKN